MTSPAERKRVPLWQSSSAARTFARVYETEAGYIIEDELQRFANTLTFVPYGD